jgi:two-component system response regulator NreC
MSDPTDALKIILADDHAVVRSGLRLVLERHTGWRIVAEGATSPTRGGTCERSGPDVLVLDLNMPGDSSLTAIP